MRGICFEVCDVVLHFDAIHRGGGQTSRTYIPSRDPGSRRCSWWYLRCSQSEAWSREMQRPGTPLYNIKLRAATSGQALPQSVFDHWDMMMDDPLEPGTQAADLVTDIRKRKGLKAQGS
ncbi:hypothetical protein MKX01_035707 [Papaver californicum]|nr:hypothetical protein MKX01_035707 [Papaver californicum]